MHRLNTLIEWWWWYMKLACEKLATVFVIIALLWIVFTVLSAISNHLRSHD